MQGYAGLAWNCRGDFGPGLFQDLVKARWVLVADQDSLSDLEGKVVATELMGFTNAI